MSWTIDPNFGSTLTTAPAVSPFSTGGGNQMLSTSGAGAVYRSDFSKLNVELTCDLFFGGTLDFNDMANGPCLIARRQIDGSFYFAALNIQFSSARAITIFRYNGTLDTFTVLTNGFAYTPTGWTTNELLKFTFRVYGDSLTARVIKVSSGNLSVEAGVFNSTISIAGNPGIGARLNSGSPQMQSFIDNLSIAEI
jgi:hypothetical protein